MNILIAGLGGIIIGFVIGYFLGKKSGPVNSQTGIVTKQMEEKSGNLAKVEELAEQQGKITNDDVQKATGVSDATAERYLQELEKEGKLKQVGADEKDTYYQKI